MTVIAMRASSAAASRRGAAAAAGTTRLGRNTSSFVVAPNPHTIQKRTSSSSKHCWSWSSGSSVRTLLLIATGIVLVGFLRIESILYRDFRDTTRRAEEDQQQHGVVGRALRHSTTTSNSKSNSNNDSSESRTRDSDRNKDNNASPNVREPENDWYDTNEDLRGANERAIVGGASPLTPRTITLDEHMNVVSSTSPFVALAVNSMANKMELEDLVVGDESRKNANPANDDEHRGHFFEFERPFYEQCEPVLQPFPKIRPTCNNIHELALATATATTTTTTSGDDESFLLSMKGSWRSVWKVGLGAKSSSNTTEFNPNNETLYDSNASAGRTNNHPARASSSSSSAAAAAAAVLKMLHLHREFDTRSFEAHATDVIVMDRLTASPYVVDAYGFCGQSVLTEFAESSGRDHVKRYDIGSRDRMRIARDLARGLADIQALRVLPHVAMVANASNSNSNSSSDAVEKYYDVDGRGKNAPIVFAHNDITIANTVMVNGKIKWNDFNIGVFMRRKRRMGSERGELLDGGNDGDGDGDDDDASSNQRHQRPPKPRSKGNATTSSEAHNSDASVSWFQAFTDANSDRTQHLCPAPVKFRSDMWRSPEEIRNTSYVQVTLSDMYGLGNILYQTMTRHQPWTYKEPGGALTQADVALRKVNGTIPTIPEQYLNTTKRELQSLFAATNLCFFPDPRKRPTARRLAYGLGSLYNRLKQKEKFSRRVILDYLLPPKLPNN